MTTETSDVLASSTSEDEEATVGRELIAGLLGVGIAVGCALPPLVHLVTGPLGPFIGGFVAGSRARPQARGRIIIAAMIGSGLAGMLFIAAKVFLSVADRSELPSWFPSSGTLMMLVGVAWVYGVVMSSVGVAVSSALAHRKAQQREE